MLGGAIKKKLIIVVDEKSKVYGELLSALITMRDDKEDTIIGVEDGLVETVIWNEKIYEDNQSQLGSNNKVVFVGKTEIAKSVIANINCKNDFSAYGIHYGYVANKAIIYVDNNFLSGNKQLYDEFYEKYYAFMKSIGTNFADSQIKDRVEIKTENIHKTEKEIGTFANKTFNALSKLNKRAAENTFDVLHKLDRKAAQGISVLVNTKEIIDQQNRCAIFSFYIDMLSAFVEE